jgi:hypothetical protein
MIKVRENLRKVAAGAAYLAKREAVIAVEPETILKNGVSPKDQMSRGVFLFLIVAIFVFSSCTKLYYVKSTSQKQNEISISPDLRQFVNKNKQISVVLRTPRTTSNVTQEVQNSELYNTIERRLMNAGFVVRDRALLEKLLVNEQLSYESIAQKIKVDLIIEVVENLRQDNIPTKIFRKKNNKEVDITARTRDRLNMLTSKFTFRIVLAETGVSCGFFTFYYASCIDGCDIYAQNVVPVYLFGNSKKEVRRRVWSNGAVFPREYIWWKEEDYISNDLSNKIINILQGR